MVYSSINRHRVPLLLAAAVTVVAAGTALGAAASVELLRRSDRHRPALGVASAFEALHLRMATLGFGVGLDRWGEEHVAVLMTTPTPTIGTRRLGIKCVHVALLLQLLA